MRSPNIWYHFNGLSYLIFCIFKIINVPPTRRVNNAQFDSLIDSSASNRELDSLSKWPDEIPWIGFEINRSKCSCSGEFDLRHPTLTRDFYYFCRVFSTARVDAPIEHMLICIIIIIHSNLILSFLIAVDDFIFRLINFVCGRVLHLYTVDHDILWIIHDFCIELFNFGIYHTNALHMLFAVQRIQVVIQKRGSPPGLKPHVLIY